MTIRKRDIDRKAQAGFTLIELIAVIVILGILSAVAVPKFLDLQEEAALAATEGVAGSLGSAFALNFAAQVVGNVNAVDVDNCTDGEVLLDGGLPDGYTITAAAIVAGTPTDCTLTGPRGKTATFQGRTNE